MLKFAAFLISKLTPVFVIFVVLSQCAIVPAFATDATDATDADALVRLALAKHLDESLQWRRLVHYRKTWFGWESEADNPLFFIAKDGRSDPRAELVATIRAGVANFDLPVAMPSAVAMTARCQYPARWKWLLGELGVPLTKLPLEKCTRYDEFLAKEKPVSVTFVFSGFFVDNPSSSFGHVLIRLNRIDHTEKTSTGAELLDYGVGYAANATTGNPLLYAIGGFAGWFPSTFSSLPFYYKVREYSDAESRDLWEYDLNLKPEEVERLTDHLWELGSTYFNYYYLKQNCAFHLLALIEAAAPRVSLLERLPFYVIPIDSVKAVTEEPGLVSRVVYRPSTARILKARLAQMTPSEQDLFIAIRNDPQPADRIKDLDPVSSAHVLDAVLDDIDYHHFRELVFKTDPEVAARKQNVLLARAKLPAGGEIKVPITIEDRPDRSHGSGRWSISGGTQSNLESSAAPDRQGTDRHGVMDGEVRFAIHDIHDPLDGYLPFSSVEFWRMRGRYDLKLSRLELQSFSLFTVTSLSPVSRIEKKPAWRVNLGLDRIRDRRCDGCLAPTAQFYAGSSFEPLDRLLLYAITGPKGETSSGFVREKWLASLGVLGGARVKLTKTWQIATEVEWRRVFDFETFDRLSSQVLVRWDHPSLNLRSPIALEAEFDVEPSAQDVLLRFIRYF